MLEKFAQYHFLVLLRQLLFRQYNCFVGEILLIFFFNARIIAQPEINWSKLHLKYSFVYSYANIKTIDLFLSICQGTIFNYSKNSLIMSIVAKKVKKSEMILIKLTHIFHFHITYVVAV